MAATFAVLDEKKPIERIISLSGNNLRKQGRGYILWDPQTAHSPFSQQELRFTDVRNDPSIVLVDSIVVDEQMQFLFLKDSV